MLPQPLKDLYWSTVGPMTIVNYWYQKALHRRRIRQEKTMLNLGSGHRYIDGFVNIETNILVKRDMWLDLRLGLPYSTATIEAIYMCHVVEHFKYNSARSLLAECRRVLAPGGGLRIVVPSVEKAIEAYRRGDVTWFPSFPDEYTSLGGKLNNYLLCRDQHKLMFDVSFINELLADAGLQRASVAGFGSSCLFNPETLARMEPMDSRGFYDDSLIIEVQVPT